MQYKQMQQQQQQRHTRQAATLYPQITPPLDEEKLGTLASEPVAIHTASIPKSCQHV